MKERLDILLQSKVINHKVYNTSLKIYEKYFENNDFIKDKVNVFMTHFAMALKRISDGNIVDKLDDVIFDQVRQSEVYDKALSYWAEIKSDLDFEIPKNEEDYFLLHLGNIFSE